MLWWVFNDDLGLHTETTSPAPMKVQIQASAYAYTCPTVADSDKVINYTTFYNYRIINKSTDVLDSVLVGMRSDVDLGFYNDNYVGCDVQNNFAFVYNGDTDDETNFGQLGYGTNTPYFSYNVLSGPVADAGDGKDNDKDGCIDCSFPLDANGEPITGGITIDENTQPEHTGLDVFLPYNDDGNAKTGNPVSTGNGIQYYRYLKGIWKDGTYIRYDNGNGTSASGAPCTFLYPGDSDPYGYGVGGGPNWPIAMSPWTEWNSTTNNQPSDRRFVASSGKFTLYSGQAKELDFAYVFTQDSAALANGNLYAKVVSDNKKIKKWFKQNNAPSCLSLNGIGLKDAAHTVTMLVYPNPASTALTIDAGNNNSLQNLKVFDILGKELIRKENMSGSQTQLNVAELPAGIYLLQLNSQEGVFVTRFVKQ